MDEEMDSLTVQSYRNSICPVTYGMYRVNPDTPWLQNIEPDFYLTAVVSAEDGSFALYKCEKDGKILDDRPHDHFGNPVEFR